LKSDITSFPVIALALLASVEKGFPAIIIAASVEFETPLSLLLRERGSPDSTLDRLTFQNELVKISEGMKLEPSFVQKACGIP
jgi:hypothetical protein